MYIFQTKCNNNIEIKIFINDVFAKTIELKFKLNLININNIVIIKIILFIFNDENVLNFDINFVCKNINDNMLHVVKLLLIFF